MLTVSRCSTLFRQLPIVFACLVFGCNRPTTPKASPKLEKPQITTEKNSAPQAPSIRYLEDESKLFAKRLGVDAFVYEFSPTCIECWLEYETTDGQSGRSDLLRFDARTVAQTDDFRNSEKTFSIVVWGHERREMNVQLGMVAISTDGQHTRSCSLGLTKKLQIPQIPRDKMGKRVFMTTRSSPYPERLPEEVDKEFVILSYGWKDDLKTNGDSVIREVTVRLKGKRLPEEKTDKTNEE